MASRLNTSFANLGCQRFGLTNPVTVTRNGAGAAIAATFTTTPQQATAAAGGVMTTIKADSDRGTGDAERPGRAVPKAWRSKRFRIMAIATAVVLAAGIGFGVGRVIGLGNTVILTAIPKPATGKDAFIEDDDGIAQDNQENILQATAPGMVHVLSGGTSVGIGLVLTESGKVLTTYQPAAGAATPGGGVRPVPRDLQGHGDRHRPGRGPGAAPAGRR